MTNKGQAMIEAVIIGAVLVTALSFCLRYALSMQQNLLVDEFIEQTLLCEAESRSNCKETLRSGLLKLNFRNLTIRSENQGNKFNLFLNGRSSFDRDFEKQSELTLDLSYTP